MVADVGFIVVSLGGLVYCCSFGVLMMFLFLLVACCCS